MRPQRTIPLAILLSVLIVAVLYMLLQIGVLGAVPWQSLLDAHGQPTARLNTSARWSSNAPGAASPRSAVTMLVLVTAFASLYGNLLGFSRIPFAAARDKAFLPLFARLHPRKDFPHVALLAVGALSLVASLFTLDQVIAFLTAGIVLIQGIAQIVALACCARGATTRRSECRSIRCPHLLRLRGWTLAFVATGILAISLGVGWLICGAIVYLVAARVQRWWPFALGRTRCAMFRGSPPAPATARNWSDLERFAHRFRPWLSGLHGRRKSVFRLRRRVFLRADSARSVATGAACV